MPAKSLKDLRCGAGQGFLFTRPVDGMDMDVLISREQPFEPVAARLA